MLAQLRRKRNHDRGQFVNVLYAGWVRSENGNGGDFLFGMELQFHDMKIKNSISMLHKGARKKEIAKIYTGCSVGQGERRDCDVCLVVTSFLRLLLHQHRTRMSCHRGCWLRRTNYIFNRRS